MLVQEQELIERAVNDMFRKIRIKMKIKKMMRIVHKCDYRTQIECVELIYKAFSTCKSHNAVEIFLNETLAVFKERGLA